MGVFFLISAFQAYAGWFDFVTDYDLSQVYLDNYTWFDFFIFFILFGGLVRGVFERRFPGNAGQALAIGLGAGLAFGLISWESYRGESIFYSLFAAIGQWWLLLVILGIVGIMLFNILHRGFFGRQLGFWSSLMISLFIILILFFILKNVADVNFPDEIEEVSGILLFILILIIIFGLIFRPRLGGHHGGAGGGVERGMMDEDRRQRRLEERNLRQRQEVEMRERRNARRESEGANREREDERRHLERRGRERENNVRRQSVIAERDIQGRYYSFIRDAAIRHGPHDRAVTQLRRRMEREIILLRRRTNEEVSAIRRNTQEQIRRLYH